MLHTSQENALKEGLKTPYILATRAGFQKRLILVSWLASFTMQAILSDK